MRSECPVGAPRSPVWDQMRIVVARLCLRLSLWLVAVRWQRRPAGTWKACLDVLTTRAIAGVAIAADVAGYLLAFEPSPRGNKVDDTITDRSQNIEEGEKFTMNRNWRGLRASAVATCFWVLASAAVCAQRAEVKVLPPATQVNLDNKTGILLLAHGGRVATWNDEVKRIAAATDKSYPTEVAFGMATRSSIQQAVDRLSERGVRNIVAVPLFVSSWSSVITSTEWLLGVRPEMPADYKLFAGMSHGPEGHGAQTSHEGTHNSGQSSAGDALARINSPVPIRMTSALNRHQIVADILADRAGSISKDPKNEVVILVAHGPNPEEDNLKWLADLKVLAESVAAKAPYHRVEYLTIRDDAEEQVAAKAKAEFRSLVENARQDGKRALVVPVLLSYGGVEHRLRDRLKGLDFTMPDQGLLPDNRIVDWVIASVRASAQ